MVTDSWDAIHDLYKQNEQYLPEYQVLCKLNSVKMQKSTNNAVNLFDLI